jgi:hypothetical protein
VTAFRGTAPAGPRIPARSLTTCVARRRSFGYCASILRSVVKAERKHQDAYHCRKYRQHGQQHPRPWTLDWDNLRRDRPVMFAMPSFWKCVEQASPLLSWRCIPNCEKFPPELRTRIKRLLDLDRSIGSAAAADAKWAPVKPQALNLTSTSFQPVHLADVVATLGPGVA